LRQASASARARSCRASLPSTLRAPRGE
jgi:hypothetical protein